MEILINNCAVDFELDKEKTINDIIASISEWTQQKDLIFTDAIINEIDYLPDNIPEIPIADVKILNCHVQSKADVIISSLDSGLDYCLKIGKYLDKSAEDNKIDEREINNITAGIDWLVEILNKSFQLLNIKYEKVLYQSQPINVFIDRVISFKEIGALKNTDKIIEYIKDKKNIFHSLAGIFRMMLLSEDVKLLSIGGNDAPDVLMKSIFDIKKEIPEHIRNLENTAIAYQTGKDIAASEKLNQFIDFIFHYNRTLLQTVKVFSLDPDNILIDDISLKKINDDIEKLLKEIINVMENNDIISLSDILEYEMKPLLEALAGYIDSIIYLLSNEN
jgi:hypothetical protein